MQNSLFPQLFGTALASSTDKLTYKGMTRQGQIFVFTERNVFETNRDR